MTIQSEMNRKKKSKKATKRETQKVTYEEFMRGLLGEVDPAKYAGEGFFATDEYFPQDIRSPWVRGDVLNEGDYYPGPDVRKIKQRRG
jgi:hypothetical protein